MSFFTERFPLCPAKVKPQLLQGPSINITLPGNPKCSLTPHFREISRVTEELAQKQKNKTNKKNLKQKEKEKIPREQKEWGRGAFTYENNRWIQQS